MDDAGAADRRRAAGRGATQVLAAEAPWPACGSLWPARLARGGRLVRRGRGGAAAPRPARDLRGQGRGCQLPDSALTLTGQARPDRPAHRRHALMIYDYKTGAPPTKQQIDHFDKQLLLVAAMAERGGLRAAWAARGASPASPISASARSRRCRRISWPRIRWPRSGTSLRAADRGAIGDPQGLYRPPRAGRQTAIGRRLRPPRPLRRMGRHRDPADAGGRAMIRDATTPPRRQVTGRRSGPLHLAVGQCRARARRGC